jgi:hypothetical protein
VLLKDNGVVTGAGTVSAPVYSTTGDLNTGIFFPAADTIAFAEGGAEAMRIDSSGQVGIGTGNTVPKTLTINGGVAAGFTDVLQLSSGSTANDAGPGLTFNNNYGSYVTNANWQLGAIRAGAPSAAQNYAGYLSFFTNSNASESSIAERMRIDSSGNVGIGTSSPAQTLHVKTSTAATPITLGVLSNATGLPALSFNGAYASTTMAGIYGNGATASNLYYTVPAGQNHYFAIADSTKMTLDASGNLLVGKTASNAATAGSELRAAGVAVHTCSGDQPLIVNRLANDGVLVEFRQDNTAEGNISVSGTTVSYNGGHLSRWAQMLTKPDLLKGTVMSNLDEMNVYVDADGNPVENEQLNKVKVSDVEGDANVAGVFVNWDYDEAHQVDEINMAMTGDMIIRIAQGVTVARGDLLMSAGDGTAKPQGDDIVRSKTIAKVTSTHVTCTYDDGSYCVPCVLMAC